MSGACRDKAGNASAPSSFSLRYDSTPPTVSGAAPDRPPDANGWFNHQVAVQFSGADATSGIASCDAPSYSGPNSDRVELSGRCRDNAGNTSGPLSFALKYDSTPPVLASLAAAPLDHGASLTWKVSADTATVMVARRGKQTTRLYAGKRLSAFTDRKLRDGVRYTYTVTAADAAGNTVTRTIAVRPSPPLVSPRRAAHVRGPVVLRWRKVPKARYYNVQLWRSGVKVLSAWPTRNRLRLATAWTYAGRAQSLAAGRYVWYVGRASASRRASASGTCSGRARSSCGTSRRAPRRHSPNGLKGFALVESSTPFVSR